MVRFCSRFRAGSITSLHSLCFCKALDYLYLSQSLSYLDACFSALPCSFIHSMAPSSFDLFRLVPGSTVPVVRFFARRAPGSCFARKAPGSVVRPEGTRFRCSVVPLFRCSVVPLFVCSFVPLFVCSFVRLFRCSVVLCSFVPLFVCSFVPLFGSCFLLLPSPLFFVSLFFVLSFTAFPSPGFPDRSAPAP
jgi:hypothetical protein